MAVDNIARGMAAKALENQGDGGSSLPIANTATVGQTIKVAAVDGDGKPTEWEAGNVSWNDLEDKPFGEKVGEVVLFPEQTISLTEGRSEEYLPLTLEIGKEYTVRFNGTVYTLAAYDYGRGAVAVGSMYAGDPFMIQWMESYGGCRLVVYSNGDFDVTQTSCTLGVSAIGETIETIDPKYLPDGIGGGGQFFVTINDQLVADKTFAETLAAFEAGNSVFCRVYQVEGFIIMSVTAVKETTISFSVAQAINSKDVLVVSVQFYDDEQIVLNMVNLSKNSVS